ncbi:MAG: thioesterase family protein [Gammaproteobacteria bacterium]|nr:thioesterase family protein [Gammaproteobacteria bacterium]
MMQSDQHNQSMLAQVAQAVTAIPFNRMLGLTLDHLSATDVEMHFKMKEDLIGNIFHGILHGGVTSAVLDMAGGMVVMAASAVRLSERSVEEQIAIMSKTSTVDLQVSYLRPGKGETFIAKAYLLKSGHHLAFARMELWNQDQILLATGTGTYALR